MVLPLAVLVLATARSDEAPPADNEKLSESFELSPDDLKRLTVGSAAKHDQPVSLAPSSVTVLTADDIKKFGYRTLAEALQSVPGFYTSYDRDRTYLGTRGFNRGDYNSRMLLLVDGHRVNNNLSDGAFLGTDFILDVDLIDKIEVIRGPGSVLYGDNAFFGVIDVRTRRGHDLATGELSGEYGSFDSYKARATYGNVFKNGIEFLVSGSFYDSAGPGTLYYPEFDTPENNHGRAQGRDTDNFKQGFGSLSYHDFTLEGAYNTRDKNDPTAPLFSVFNTSRTHNDDARGFADLRYEHTFLEDLNVSAKLYYDRSELTADLLYPDSLNREIQVGEWWGAEAQVSKKVYDRHTFTFGAEYRDDFRQERKNYSDDLLNIEQLGSRQSYGVYLQSEIALRTNLFLNAGARYDWYSTFGDTWNPRVALILQPWQSTTFKAIGGTAFRSPNFFERIFNSALQPETITTYELVYDQAYGSHWHSALSLYENEIDNLITFRDNTYQNLEGADAHGVEAELRGTFARGLSTRLSYAFQETKDRETGSILTDSPKHLGKANVTVPLPIPHLEDKFFADLEAQYTSRRMTLFGGHDSGFGLFNFTLFSQNLLPGLEVSGSVYNLLDKRYSDPATPFHIQELIEQNGRTFRVKVTYRF